MKVEKSEFAANIRAERERLGLTQAQMAEKLNIGSRKYVFWEDKESHRWPDVPEFFQLGEITDKDPNYLVGHAPFMREANKEIKLKMIYDRILNDKDFYMFVYVAMSKNSDALSALLAYWMAEDYVK